MSVVECRVGVYTPYSGEHHTWPISFFPPKVVFLYFVLYFSVVVWDILKIIFIPLL